MTGVKVIAENLLSNVRKMFFEAKGRGKHFKKRGPKIYNDDR